MRIFQQALRKLNAFHQLQTGAFELATAGGCAI
jgi:hypothetical protein